MPNTIQCYQVKNKDGVKLNGLDIQTSWNIFDISKKESPEEAVSELVELLRPTKLVISEKDLNFHEFNNIKEAFKNTIWEKCELLVSKEKRMLNDAIKTIIQKTFDLDVKIELIILDNQSEKITLTINDNGHIFITGAPSLITDTYVEECKQHLGRWTFIGHF